MPKSKTFLTPAEYAVLGLVRERATYGYELQRQLTERHGLGRVCPVEPAMVYAILKSLSGLELIDGQWDSRVYPPKAVYTATDAGELEFQRWLQRPVGRMREVRLDFLIKLHFALKEDPLLARRLIESQIEACQEYAQGIEHEQQDASDVYDRIVLESKASAARITQDWLEKALTGLEPA